MLQNNRILNITWFNNRTSTKGQPAQISVEELISVFSGPVRGTESMDEFAGWNKRQQDDAKDVGAFVGGIFEDNRRKANKLKSLSILTYDCDKNVPLDLPKRLHALGCFFIMYPTRKSTPASPRYRFIIILDKDISPEMYTPIGLKFGKYIDPSLELFDPASFRPNQLMYKPSCCSDSPYRVEYADKPFISVDGILDLYSDWRNVQEWPQVPGAQQTAPKLAAKQGDPTAKSGVVGAFCKTYDVYRAMDELIPGTYEPVDTEPGRYTYTGGTTTGGAIIYDNGQFLYSHHATDPCSGKLVNAFDLVRLHKFGDLDDEAKEGTPVVKLPSFMAMGELAMSCAEVASLVHKERGAQAIAEFREIAETAAGGTVQGISEDVTEQLGQMEGTFLTIQTVRKTIGLFGITARNNLITNEIELVGYPAAWSKENAVNNLPVQLLDVLRKARVKGASKNGIEDCLAIIADECRFNPVLDMLQNYAWDGIDRFPEVYELLGITDPFSQLLIRKWFVQGAAMAANDGDKPYGADGVLTLQGDQGIGKTLFFAQMAMDSQWFIEGVSLNPGDRDSVVKATSSWICELGELDSTMKRDQAALKAFITSAKDKVRLPYARSAVTRPRRTSFCATVNPGEYLVDETGDRVFGQSKLKR